MKTTLRLMALGATALTAVACANQQTDPTVHRAKAETPVEVKVTGFDRGLYCLAPLAKAHLKDDVFAAFKFYDRTGKENYGESGVGKFVGQGDEHYTMAALSKAGVRQVNFMASDFLKILYDRSSEDVQKRMRSMALVPTIALDGATTDFGFTSSSAVGVKYGGIGPTLRRNGVSITKVMHTTNVMTGEILKSTQYDVIVTATEVGFGIFRVFGQELVELDAGFNDRTLIPFVTRGAQTWLTFEHVAALLPDSPQKAECRKFVTAALENVEYKQTDLKTGEQQTKETVASLDSIERSHASTKRSVSSRNQ
jgi:curli biogenesis system outer membrane secretion channel CsgG